MESLQQLEAVCEQLYNSPDPATRRQSEQLLRGFGSNPEYIPQCKAILDNSSNPFAQHLAASSLTRLLVDSSLTSQLRLDIRNYVLAYLSSKGERLEAFVQTALMQLLVRVCKVGWFDGDMQHDIVQDLSLFLGQRARWAYLIGLRSFSTLIQEMNTPAAGYSLVQQRKTAVAFRDSSLLAVFSIGLASLRQMQADPSSDGVLLEAAVTVVLRCLSYDFVGTALDESVEDLGTIQVPSSWRPLLEDPTTLQSLMDCYTANKPPVSCLALECLVRLASVRRSLFSAEAERTAFLTNLIRGTTEVLRGRIGLTEHNNYHEFCRLLARLKTNYQLSELVAVEGYQEWIGLVADFTVTSLKSWQWTSHSVFYLLSLWSRLVSSVPYLKATTADAPSLLENHVAQIVEAFLSSRLESTAAVDLGPDLDLLASEDAVTEQLEALPPLLRFQYEDTCRLLCRLFEPLAARYGEAAASGALSGTSAAGAAELAVVEGQLTWLVYVIGAVIRGRLSSAAADSQETLDGELAVRAFQLVRVMDVGPLLAARAGEQSRQRLELAVLAFFQNFRKVYVGEQAMHSSKVYVQMSEHAGLHDHLAVLNACVAKASTNLAAYARCEEVVESSLYLLNELASGYMSGKLLLKLDSVSMAMQHHTADHFAFLREPANARSRTAFYATLGRLLFTEDSTVKFKAFVAPFDALSAQLLQLYQQNPAGFRTAQTRALLSGLFRDLRGVVSATASRRTYCMLFDWVYPQHMPLWLAAMETFADSPDVANPLLKLLAELVQNRTQRITFEPSSVSGILLFRELSRLVCAYGQRLLAQPVPAADPYSNRYKGVAAAHTALQRALSGNYVNFGVFDLYGDRALSEVLDCSLLLAVSTPLDDLLGFRKVSKAYYSLIEVICHNHLKAIVTADSRVFAYVAASLAAGLKSLDTTTSSQCATAIDAIAAAHFQAQPITDSSSLTAKALARHLAEMPNLLPEMLRTLFDIVLFEDCSNQWSLSRPMLSLILVNEGIFNDLKVQIAVTQVAEKRARLAQCFDKLLTDVTRSLEPKNRDRFTQNLTAFRHDMQTRA